MSKHGLVKGNHENDDTFSAIKISIQMLLVCQRVSWVFPEFYFTQLTFPDFTSLELPPIMIVKSPGSQSYFRL